MDILAHALWTNAIYKGVQKRRRTVWEISQIIFWSDFPDFASFTVFGVYNFINNGFAYLPGSEYDVPSRLSFLLPLVYSLPFFTLVFFAIFLIRGKPYWAMGGWFIHIAIDIFTHANFFPPHFLWPFSDYTFHGLYYDDPLFILINYSAIVIVYAYWFTDLRKKKAWN